MTIHLYSNSYVTVHQIKPREYHICGVKGTGFEGTFKLARSGPEAMQTVATMLAGQVKHLEDYEEIQAGRILRLEEEKESFRREVEALRTHMAAAIAAAVEGATAALVERVERLETAELDRREL